MKPLLLSVDEFCRLAGGIGKTTAYAILAANEVERVKIRGRTFVTLESVERLIERSTQKAHR